MTNAERIQANLDELARWFATRRPNFLETASRGERQQWEDRVREREALTFRLNVLKAS